MSIIEVLPIEVLPSFVISFSFNQFIHQFIIKTIVYF